MVKGSYRAIGRVGETEGASRLDCIVDKRLKEAGMGRTARDRLKELLDSLRSHITKQTSAQTTFQALESRERSARTGPDRSN
jgi:hypothetical protein